MRHHYYDQGPDNRAVIATILAILMCLAIAGLVLFEMYTQDECIEAVMATGNPTVQALAICDTRLRR
jgi:hypothetical protein